MIKKLSIKNFKSIKNVEMDCRRVNLFIGEPNTGKSNILETLGLLCWCGHGGLLRDYVRFQNTPNLFYDELLDQQIEIETETETDTLSFKMKFENDRFHLEAKSVKQRKGTTGTLEYSGVGHIHSSELFKFIKFYRFAKQDKFPQTGSSFLLPPHGSNLFAVVMANRKFRDTMRRFFKNFGFNLVLKPQERTFEIQKQVEDLVFSYPYTLTSETLQRIIFHVIAIESNKNSTLVFEEPEAHAFPYYTKYLGEKIALDSSNQYFIATHNPYLLLSILEKAKKNDVNVFITYFQDYQTKLKGLDGEQLSELMDYDPFFNLNSFIEEEHDDSGRV
jgi:hypothetical protein